MYNLAKAAEAGWQGSVADARDFEVVSNITRDFVAVHGDTAHPQPNPSLVQSFCFPQTPH